MTSFTKLEPSYFKTYLEQLPQNAQAHKKFSYDPWVSNCPNLSLRNFFGIVRFVLSYPFARLHDFWKQRQVSQNIVHARQQAVDTLKRETQFDLPIKIQAVGALALKRAPHAQAQQIAELEQDGDDDLAHDVRLSPASEFADPIRTLNEATFDDYAEGIDEITGALSKDATDTLFLEMATQRLPERLIADTRAHVFKTYGMHYVLVEKENEDDIDVENRQITINRTFTLLDGGLEVGTLKMGALFDCVNETGYTSFDAQMYGVEA